MENPGECPPEISNDLNGMWVSNIVVDDNDPTGALNNVDDEPATSGLSDMDDADDSEGCDEPQWDDLSLLQKAGTICDMTS